MTRSELALKVAGRLGIYDQSGIEADTQQQILDAYDALYLGLKDDGLVTWAQPTEIGNEDIPSRFGLVLPLMVAAELVDTFTIPESRAVRIITLSIGAKKRYCQQLRTGQDPDTTEADYF